ncbi:hypothetical protein B0H17DRAFT_1176646 [Mycena rosella]|uniref:C2H2-type domain-containing protein n=1 Tax=Mycena rosella TaxID=1033263 RepID=A0AAD7DWC2_MYCRO|nr:hypothetical protein B0H17DRAFT_1176646 [Mycena rosella]
MSLAMPRSTSMQPLPQKGEPDNGATCEICGLYLRRNTDLPRHMLIHSKDKQNLMFTCPMDGCGHQTLQKSNLATHIRTHTRAKPHKCPESFPNGQKCDFSTADPSSLHRHRKRKHGYTPRPKPHPYARVRRARADPAVGRDAESDCESEESFGPRAEGSRVRSREEDDGGGVEGMGDDADADADADADGEPDPEMEMEMGAPLHIENVSAERTAPPPEPSAHPPSISELRELPPVLEHRPILDLELGPPTIPLPLLVNISNTRVGLDSTPARFVVDTQ